MNPMQIWWNKRRQDRAIKRQQEYEQGERDRKSDLARLDLHVEATKTELTALGYRCPKLSSVIRCINSSMLGSSCYWKAYFYVTDPHMKLYKVSVNTSGAMEMEVVK